MKYIKLTLWTEEPENRYSHTIGVEDKDYSKAIKIIKEINTPFKMPNIRVIQDDYCWSDEIDVVLEALQTAGIKVSTLPIEEEFTINVGVAEKSETDKIFKNLKCSQNNKKK